MKRKATETKRSAEISIPTMKPTPCKEEEVVIEDKLKRPRKRNKNYIQEDSDHNDSEGISFLLIHSFLYIHRYMHNS